jgi:hypothetical protein
MTDARHGVRQSRARFADLSEDHLGRHIHVTRVRTRNDAARNMASRGDDVAAAQRDRIDGVV